MRLQRTHLNAQYPLALRGERGEDVPLQPPEHEGLELLVQVPDLLFVVGIVQVELVGELDCSVVAVDRVRRGGIVPVMVRVMEAASVGRRQCARR